MMKFLVTFGKRNSEGFVPADEPQSMIDPGDGVIEDCEFVELVEPGLGEETDEGDEVEEGNEDAVPTLSTESWVYTVADGREKEFTDTLRESRSVLTFEEIPDDAPTA
jgi:hypothetical protein